MPQLARWLTFIEEFDYEIVHRNGKQHSNCDGLSRRAEPLAASRKRATESVSKSTSSEQLDMAYDETDTAQDEVIDSEQSDFEEHIPSARHVHVPSEERAETEVKPSVRRASQSVSSLILSWESSSDCASSPPSNRRSIYCQPSQRAPRSCITNGSGWKYEKGSSDEEPKESLVSNLTHSCSFLVIQFKTSSPMKRALQI